MHRSRIFFMVAALASSLAGVHGQTPTVTTLAHFGGVSPAATEGNSPRGGLVFGADGQLYGTTEAGGTGSGSGYGVAYKIDTSGTFTRLVQFTGSTTGSVPTGKLTLAGDGNYYGTTTSGGTDGSGTIFQLTPAGVLTTVYSFTVANRVDKGSVPTDHLVLGNDGYLYGTTTQGGTSGITGYGIIFKILPGASNTPIRLISFTGPGGSQTGSNASALLLAKDGNFYGTTEAGGLYGFGSVFKLTSAGAFTTISHLGSITGTYLGPKSPRAALIQASNGLLYGTSAAGGTAGHGTVFSVTTAGSFATIVNFTGDGGSYPGDTPEAELMQATDGYLYGTTRLGGTATSKRGTIFRQIIGGAFKSLIQFTGGSPIYGAEPRGALVQDNDGRLYGTTTIGGLNSLGTVFRLDSALPIKATVSTGGITDPSGGTRATLTGTLNPQGTAAMYHFEYGLTASYGSRMPATDASAGSGKANVSVKTTITGLTPSTTYHYRLVVSNGGGISWGSDQSFVTGPNPNIITPPAPQLVGIGTPAQFEVGAVGSEALALKYAWFKTTSSSSVGSAAIYKIAKAAVTHAGSYYVRVTYGSDTVQTASVPLGVISVANTAVTVNEDDEVTLKLANGGTGLSFQWKTAAGDVVDDTRVTGAQTPNLRITHANASDTNTYFCTVTLGSLTLNSGNFVVTTLLRPDMNPPSLGPWTTNAQAFGSVSALNSPTRFYAVGQLINPSEVKINPLTGELSGRPKAPGVYSIQFTASNAAGVSEVTNYFVTVLAANPNATGNFAGLVDRDATANNNLGGNISFTLSSPSGVGSGNVTYRGTRYSFTAALGNVPGATRDIVITKPSPATGFPPIVATLTEATGNIDGTVNGADFSATRIPDWKATTNQVSANQSGRFNIALSPSSSLVGDYPRGSGYLSALITPTTGVAVLSGKLADGTAVTCTTWINAAGEIPGHFALLEKGKYELGTGSAQGLVTIGTDSSVSAVIDWGKATQVGVTRSYKNGFNLHTLDAVGSKYVKPVSTPIIGLTNAQFTFADGGLSPALTKAVTFTTANAISIPLPNANTIKVTALDTATGIFSGSFALPDTLVPANSRTALFGGILLQGTHEGRGHFNLAELPNPTTSAIQSGSVLLAAPAP